VNTNGMKLVVTLFLVRWTFLAKIIHHFESLSLNAEGWCCIVVLQTELFMLWMEGGEAILSLWREEDQSR
jgi:hypothetical protein